MKKYVTVALAAALFAACSPGKQFTTKDIEASKVKSIAILPVQVNFTGTLPNKITPAMLDSMKVQQCLAFQHALEANLLRYSDGKKKISGVSFQSADKTNGLLTKNNLRLQDVGSKDPDELAKLLQVDAVVKMNVNSNRLMSDLASLGLGTLRNILFWGTNTNPGVSSSISNKTADVYADCALVKDGRTLWTAQYNRGTDWNTSVNDVMNNITKKIGKGFPY